MPTTASTVKPKGIGGAGLIPIIFSNATSNITAIKQPTEHLRMKVLSGPLCAETRLRVGTSNRLVNRHLNGERKIALQDNTQHRPGRSTRTLDRRGCVFLPDATPGVSLLVCFREDLAFRALGITSFRQKRIGCDRDSIVRLATTMTFFGSVPV